MLMDLNIFKKPDKTGKMSREKYLFNNYPEEYDYIIKWCKKYDLVELPLKEKIYLCLNDLSNKPKCRNTSCNNFTKFKNRTIGYLSYCSNKCIGSDLNMIKQKQQKSIKNYGTKTPAESKEIKDKIIRTNNKKYGFNSPMSNKIIRNKSNETLMKNWGVDNPNKHKDIIKKRVKSFKKNIKQYKKSYKKTSLKKYGFDHPWKDNNIHQKSINNSKKTKDKILENLIIERLKNNNDIDYLDINFDNRFVKLYCKICKNEFDIHREYFSIRHKENNVLCTNCNPLKKHISGLEIELSNFIKSVYNSEVINNDRSLLIDKEIDIYLPNEKLAFEFNGLYWHNEQNKTKRYHLNKTNDCIENGVELVHIWEDDWKLNKEIIKSIIKNKLKLNDNIIYARKCSINKVNINESKKFLNENHILGNCNSKIKLGLYFNDKLTSIMCFRKSRNNNDIELIRFCNKKDTSVVGGANKLFNHFINNYSYDRVISFSDTSMYNGNMYRKLGFFLEKNTPVDYKWVLAKKRNHKSNFRKSNLVKLGYDSKKSEKEILYENFNGYRIWDCGLKKWIYNK